MKFLSLFFYPLRLFSPARKTSWDDSAKRKQNPRTKDPVPKQKQSVMKHGFGVGPGRGTAHGKDIIGTAKGLFGNSLGQRGGSENWSRWINLFSIVLLAFSCYVLLAWLELEPVFHQVYGYHGLIDWRSQQWIQGGGQYRYVLAVAITASHISLIQITLLLITVFLGFRLFFLQLGIWTNGYLWHPPLKGTIRFSFLAVILQPGLGMLSSVVGVLSSSRLPTQAVTELIFGPTGIGVLGFLLAVMVQNWAEHSSGY